MYWFIILSDPTRVRNGVFGVLQATLDGIELKQFTTLSEASAYHQQMMMSLNMAVDLPVQLIRIGNEPSFSVLRERFEEAYRQRIGEHRNFTVALQSVCSIYKRCTDRLSEFLSHHPI
jgi:hypothetical protein